MSRLAVFLFGAPRIKRDGAAVALERRKSLALLAYLAVTRQPHGRDALATLLWPEADSESARAGLRRALVDLNASLGKGWIEAEGDQIVLRAEPGVQTDVGRFHDALDQVAAHSHPPHRLCDACLVNLTAAVSLYTADFLAGFTLADAAEFDDWQSFQTESLRLALAGALEKLATGLAGRQEYAAALPHARRWLALDPLHEPAHRLLMQLHAQAGERAAALRQYDECVKVLHDELGIEPEPETTALCAALRSGAAPERGVSLQPLSPAAPLHNLPPDLTPFIGRERELAHIAGRLADPACRLLTVLGPGGMGKTRLAIQAARAQTDVFAHGVFFVDLAPVATPDFLAAAILRDLAITPAAADPQAQLIASLRAKHLLLVLDNFEHLVEGGAGLLPQLLAAAPKVKLLVTSRARLNLREEWLAPLEGLSVPSDQDSSDDFSRSPAPYPATEVVTTNLEHYDATTLFLASVRRMCPDFRPNAEDARQIAHICRLLEGMPLAIELAAARIRTLPLEKLAQQLERGLQLLSTNLRDMPQRHRSMTAAFDHAWRLLTPRQQSLLRQFSVFRGRCTLEAAAAVTGASLDDLQELTDASWLRPGSDGRYSLHELTRQYCAGKLEMEHACATGELPEQVRERYAAYYRALLLARQGEFYRRPGVLTEMNADAPDLLAAWNQLAAQDSLEAGRRMILGLFSVVDGQMSESPIRSILEMYRTTELASVRQKPQPASWEAWQAWVAEVTGLLAHGNAGDPWWREASWLLRYRVAQGNFGWGEYAKSAAEFGRLLHELDEGRFNPWPHTVEARRCWQIDSYVWLEISLFNLGQYTEVQRLAERIIALAEQMDSLLYRALGQIGLVYALIYQGYCREAENQAREYQKTCRSLRNPSLEASALWAIAQTLAGQGDYLRARACLRRTAAFGRESGYLMQALHHLGGVELALGNLAQAKRFYQEAIAICESWSFPLGLAAALTGLARVAIARGELAAAQDLLRRALRTPARSVQHTIDAIAAIAEIQQMEGRWEAAAELCAALLSWPETPVYASEIVLHLRATLEAQLEELGKQLAPEIFAAAAARGRARELDDVAAELIAESG